jgi:hypothetical protein
VVGGTGGTRVSLEATTAHDLGPYCGRR